MKYCYHNRLIAEVLRISLIISGASLPLYAQDGPIGWATAGEGTTGGKDGDTIYAGNREQFLTALMAVPPCVIVIKDTIDLEFGERVPVKSSHITICGGNENAMLRHGGLELRGNNVIIQNLTIGQSYTPGHWDGKGEPKTDAITMYGKNIWVDHCDLFQSHDGLIDFGDRNGECADYVTVSWTRFSNHNKVMLIGNNDEDSLCRDKFRVTIHHCWFDGYSSFYDTVDQATHRLQQRMPRVRYGTVHVFNNYYETADDYCIAARIESKVVAESNYFRNLEDAHFLDDIGKGNRDPELLAKGNIYDNVNGDTLSYGTAFDPSLFYAYEIGDAVNIPSIVMNGAGRFNRKSNHAPVAVTDTIVLNGSEKVRIEALNNDSDADGDQLRISAIKNQIPGNITILPDCIEYTPDANFKGDLPPVVYYLIDYQGGIAEGSIVIRKPEMD